MAFGCIYIFWWPLGVLWWHLGAMMLALDWLPARPLPPPPPPPPSAFGRRTAGLARCPPSKLLSSRTAREPNRLLAFSCLPPSSDVPLRCCAPLLGASRHRLFSPTRQPRHSLISIARLAPCLILIFLGSYLGSLSFFFFAVVAVSLPPFTPSLSGSWSTSVVDQPRLAANADRLSCSTVGIIFCPFALHSASLFGNSRAFNFLFHSYFLINLASWSGTMADFRQLALEFVLADDEAKQKGFAKQAAQGKSSRNR